jgi:hypothetical protein
VRDRPERYLTVPTTIVKTVSPSSDQIPEAIGVVQTKHPSANGS